jgi:hypothetical protein
MGDPSFENILSAKWAAQRRWFHNNDVADLCRFRILEPVGF